MWGVRSVTVNFGQTTVLDSVDLALPSGQVTALVGGDGAGKTTLLRVLLRHLALQGGQVFMPDADQIGYQPSSSGVWQSLSVQENIEFVGEAYGLSRSRCNSRAHELLERAGLAHARDRLGGQLSGGMRQKLGFCLAMLHEPEVLLLDEPSTGVDPVSRVELWRLIAETATSGTAVCMTPTYLDEAERAATVVALDAGRVLASDQPGNIVASVPGTISSSDRRPRGLPGEYTWRRGAAFHTWTPPGGEPGSGQPVAVDLEDALVALMLAQLDEEAATMAGRRQAS